MEDFEHGSWVVVAKPACEYLYVLSYVKISMNIKSDEILI
jgi:delta-aminolevulinic acid dehydratase/porphobilinogen synthase